MKDLHDIKFNFNQEMLDDLVKFEDEKKKLIELYNLDKNDDILLQIMECEQKLSNYRQRFIESFRKNNKEEIKEYIEIKDKE